MKELEILLENYWISKDENKELYYRVKDSIPEFKGFLSDKLGYHVLVNPYLIKLEKLPGKAEAWMGIQEFESPMEYGFLCLLLMFLEDKEREEQFVLSTITEFIQGNYPGEERVDWTLFRHRRCLIKTLRVAADIGLIQVDDGNEQSFAHDESSEVLYESTGLSRYFVRNFHVNILGYTSYKDIENEELMDIDRDRGLLRRQRVYRRLLMSPVVYHEGPEDTDYAYIKNFRSVIENDFERYLGLPLHVHRNGALLMLPESHTFKGVFPDNKAISEIVLQMNYMIQEDIKAGVFNIEKDDTLVISGVAFEVMVKRLKNENAMGWSKEYREMPLDRLVSGILEYMKGFHMIEIINRKKEIRVMPLVGKIGGRYPEDFIEKSQWQQEVAMDAE
ncbi:TIGR02678 family protein [Anaerosolibacter sp.]|uniref:TIGR02678 family protein n=1 Tax=Anaerosolibacter sp. TaxID=1872527 RepID=UPI0039F02FD5